MRVPSKVEGHRRIRKEVDSDYRCKEVIPSGNVKDFLRKEFPIGSLFFTDGFLKKVLVLNQRAVPLRDCLLLIEKPEDQEKPALAKYKRGGLFDKRW